VIVINVDVMLAKRKMSVTALAERLGFTLANVSMLKTGKIKALKMTTLDKLCKELDCQPGDILEYVEGDLEHDDE
jgi:putative transcriptional regulator